MTKGTADADCGYSNGEQSGQQMRSPRSQSALRLSLPLHMCHSSLLTNRIMLHPLPAPLVLQWTGSLDPAAQTSFAEIAVTAVKKVPALHRLAGPTES